MIDDTVKPAIEWIDGRLSVVPDVAFVADFIALSRDERQYPTVAPDIVVEVRSPGDDTAEIIKKRDFYPR